MLKIKFKQNLSLLLWLYFGKTSKDGKAPIYVRITIDGLDTDISLGKKIHPQFWDSDAKIVTGGGLETKLIVYLGLPATQIKKGHITSNMSSQTLLEAFDDFIATFKKKAEKGLRSNGTLRHWRSIEL